MGKYLFKSNVTMKAYNYKKWWIDGDIINDITIAADTLADALEKYKKFVENKGYISISKNALKNKQAMYVDTPTGVIQCGYVITGKTDFQDDNTYRCVEQYINIWVTISIIQNPFEIKDGK